MFVTSIVQPAHIAMRGKVNDERERETDRKKEQTCARDASHTYEITRYFCHPSPRPANVSTPPLLSRPAQQENAKGEQAHVHACTCTQLATYACVSFNRGLKRRRGGGGGQGLESVEEGKPVGGLERRQQAAWHEKRSSAPRF